MRDVHKASKEAELAEGVEAAAGGSPAAAAAQAADSGLGLCVQLHGRNSTGHMHHIYGLHQVVGPLAAPRQLRRLQQLILG
jgi:hypothetical protein